MELKRTAIPEHGGNGASGVGKGGVCRITPLQLGFHLSGGGQCLANGIYAAVFLRTDGLFRKEQSVRSIKRQGRLIRITPITVAEIKRESDCPGSVASKMKNRTRHSGFGYIFLQCTGRNMVHHAEERNKIAFPRAVCTKKNRHIIKRQIDPFAYGLEPGD